MRYTRLATQTGEAYILMDEVVAIVRHHGKPSLLGEEPFNVDLHMKSGTIFVVIDYTEQNFWALLNVWEMFRRPFKDDAVLSPAYIEDGKVREL